MRKFIVLAALAAFTFGVAGMAHALDVKATGEFKANYTYWSNKDWVSTDINNRQVKHNSMQHRARVYFNFRANENVNMNVAFEMGFIWGTETLGNETLGGDISADAVAVRVKRAYLEFKWPTYQSLITTVGTMGAVFPNSGYFGSAILDDDMSGITVANKWNETVSTVLGFWRLKDANTSFAGARVSEGDSAFDATLLAVPLNFEGFKIKPFFALAFLGKNFDGISPSNYTSLPSSNSIHVLRNQATPWWVGSGFEVNMLDPFMIYADFNYGNLDQKAKYEKRKGWLADLAVQYNGLSWFVPSMSAWYASGVDGNVHNGDERMPVISGAWTQSNMLNLGGRILNDDTAKIAYIGSWGIGAKLEKISFVEDLRHDLVFSFYKGTNDKDVIGTDAALRYGTDLTEKDHVFAIDFNNTYKIMEELSFIADLGIAWPSFDKKTWRKTEGSRVDNQTQMWRTSVGFVYKF